MNTRLEMGKVAGSRPAFSSAARRMGTLWEKWAVLEPPEPIQPSAMVAARRNASGWPPPNKLKDLAPIVDLGLGPQRFNEFHPFAEPPHTTLSGYLELGVMCLPPQSYSQDGAAVAHIIQRGHLVRNMHGAVDG